MLETAIFDEITFAKNEAILDVLTALVVEYDKMDYIMSHSDCSEQFSIVQESFTKPRSDESVVTKIALAIPRAIYIIIKSIVDGFKNAFGKKESFWTPEVINGSFKIMDNLTSDPEVMKLVCGAVVGTAAAVGAFCKARYNKAKQKITEYTTEHRERKETRAAIQYEFANFKTKAKSMINDMFALYVDEDDKVGLILFTDIDDIRVNGVDRYLKSIKTHVDDICSQSGHLTSKGKFDDKMKDVLFDIDHNVVLFRHMIPDTVFPKDYTINEYNKAMSKFASADFSNKTKDALKDIENSIVMAYQSFEKSSEKADAKEESLAKKAKKNYGLEIVHIVEQRINFMKEWLIELNNAINKAIDEYNKTMKDKVEKLTPSKEISENTKEDWLADKAVKDEQRKAEKEKSEKEMKRRTDAEGIEEGTITTYDKEGNKISETKTGGNKSSEKSEDSKEEKKEDKENKESDDDKSSKKEEKESDD